MTYRQSLNYAFVTGKRKQTCKLTAMLLRLEQCETAYSSALLLLQSHTIMVSTTCRDHPSIASQCTHFLQLSLLVIVLPEDLLQRLELNVSDPSAYCL